MEARRRSSRKFVALRAPGCLFSKVAPFAKFPKRSAYSGEGAKHPPTQGGTRFGRFGLRRHRFRRSVRFDR
eukprot:14476900-Alexandrium_andersonii.AAC.1